MDKFDALKSPSSSTSGKFANPWEDLASNYAPTTIPSALELCEFLYINDSTYRKASERIVNYFLTDCKFTGQAGKEQDKFWNIMVHDFDLMGNLQAVGYDFMCYGNSFATASFPFVRAIQCSTCRGERNIDQVDNFDFDLQTGKVITFCPKCHSDRHHHINDYKKRISSKIKLVRWDPKLLTLEANRLTHHIEYWSKIPPEIKAGVQQKNKFYIRTTPKMFLEAARQDKAFKFNPSQIFHLKEPHLAGMWLGGWGLPSILSSFKNFFRLQTLRRYNEALMMDYIVPLRILSPRQGSYQEGNSIYNNLMRDWRTQMQDAVVRHRDSATNWNFFPFPVEYQAVGGEGTSLAPLELIDSEEDKLLNGRGIPPELYRSTMTLQAAPIALRVFERNWSSLVRGMNALAEYATDAVSSYMGSGDYDVELESVRIIDDLENKAWRLQAMAAGMLSKETAMAPMGISDVAEEHKKVLDEQVREQQAAQKQQQDFEMSQMGLGQTEEGAEEGEGQVTPDNINAQGDQMARELLQMDEATRRRQLHAISQQNEALHAVVLKRMDVLRNQARSLGMGEAMGQVLQQAPPPQDSGGGTQQ